MNNPKYISVDGVKYEIDTDFRTALKCNRIAKDPDIDDSERALAILYTLFGNFAFTCQNKNKMLELALKYISLGRAEEGFKNDSRKDYELDFDKCKGLIESSFKFDYNYNPYKMEYLHWYDFYNDLENLSTSEFGNCCILNRITEILNQNLSEIKDSKRRRQVADAQKLIKEKYCNVKEREIDITEEQLESSINFYKQLGITF